MAWITHSPIGLALMLAGAGCSAGDALPVASARTLDPIAFFIGRTHGQGQLTKLLGGTTPVTVDSVGRRQSGMLVLDQRIREGTKVSARTWTMRPTGTNLYSGTLTDATGPVSILVAGARADIRYTMKGGLNVRQQLALQSDGATMINHLEVRKFGIRVAKLDEVIRK